MLGHLQVKEKSIVLHIFKPKELISIFFLKTSVWLKYTSLLFKKSNFFNLLEKMHIQMKKINLHHKP